ncbi:MAG: Hsp20/alpha crystallin family protein [candidate division WOR-3 bacterium]
MREMMRWDPFREMAELSERLNRFFEERWMRPWTEEGVWSPLVNLEETKDAYILRAELPGMDRKDIKLSLTERTLSISGERRWEKKDESATVHRAEIFCGRFQRTISFPAEIDPQKATARYENGILTVELPKSEKAKPREIEIEVK